MSAVLRGRRGVRTYPVGPPVAWLNVVAYSNHTKNTYEPADAHRTPVIEATSAATIQNDRIGTQARHLGWGL